MVNIMKVLEKENFDLRIASVTVADDEINVIQLDEGEGINVRGGYYKAPSKVTLVVDRLGYTNSGAVKCSGIRQEIEGWDVWQNWAYASHDRYYRNLCASRGAEQVHVPGGMPPLVQRDQIAIPDFSMSGTNWFIMPYSVWQEIERERERA